MSVRRRIAVSHDGVRMADAVQSSVAALNKLQEGRWGDIQWDKPPNSHRRDISATKFSGN